MKPYHEAKEHSADDIFSFFVFFLAKLYSRGRVWVSNCSWELEERYDYVELGSGKQRQSETLRYNTQLVVEQTNQSIIQPIVK